MFKPTLPILQQITKLKMPEWIAIVYDVPNTDRTNVRQQHLDGIPANVSNGKIVSAGAIFNEVPTPNSKPNFAGSVLNVIAESKEEVIELLKTDIYAKTGIWDLNNVLIYPVGIAYRKGKDL